MGKSSNPNVGSSDKMNINRRRVLASLAGAGTVSVAGCSGGGSSGESESEADSESSSGSEDRYGGHLRTAFEDTTANLNPMLQASTTGYAYLSQLYSSLIIIDEDLELKGDLARDWEGNSDGTEWTFTLRENATWHHNGENVTAQDVKATFEAVNDPDTGSPGREVINNIESMEATGEY